MNINSCDNKYYFNFPCEKEPSVFIYIKYGIYFFEENSFVKMCEQHWLRIIKDYKGIVNDINGKYGYKNVVIISKEKYMKYTTLL